MSEIVFLSAIALTFVFAFLGRKHAPDNSVGLSHQRLNKWLVGLSAGATANSGFVVTGAVGLGYVFGYKWLLLPLGWFIGDLVFWRYFPGKLNDASQKIQASSVTDILTYGLDNKFKKIIKWLAAILIIICLSGYTTAQWLAGQKVLSGAFNISEVGAVSIFAVIVIAYTAIGGFRGSVYADTFQSIFRIVGSILALGTVIWLATDNPQQFSSNFSGVDKNFFSPLGDFGIVSAIAFVLGYAFASLGFGLGQPQITNRYLAGVSPEETRAAKWIYISYVQFTWVSMTVFGMLLRGVMPDLKDPEQGFGIFFETYFPGVITGLILADIFAAMASTSNSLLITMAQTVRNDLGFVTKRRGNNSLLIITAILGLATLALSLSLESSIVSVALTSVSLLASGLAPVMMIRLFKWRHTGLSLAISIIFGFILALGWIQAGGSGFINEAAPGMLGGLLINYVMSSKFMQQMTNNNQGQI